MMFGSFMALHSHLAAQNVMFACDNAYCSSTIYRQWRFWRKGTDLLGKDPFTRRGFTQQSPHHPALDDLNQQQGARQHQEAESSEDRLRFIHTRVYKSQR
jgi:hypothetical protein